MLIDVIGKTVLRIQTCPKCQTGLLSDFIEVRGRRLVYRCGTCRTLVILREEDKPQMLCPLPDGKYYNITLQRIEEHG